MASKFLQRTFNGWKVSGVENVNLNHKRFFLTKWVGDQIHTIMVRDNELTKLGRGEKTVEDILKGKAKCLEKGIYEFQNTVYKR